MKKKIFALVMISVMTLGMFGGCSSEEETAEEEEIVEQTLTVSDPDYYTRFKGKDISINVYNWGEYISDGSEGSINVNEEFEKYCLEEF